jgi:ribA/ribD-fused uncharacterized protein
MTNQPGDVALAVIHAAHQARPVMDPKWRRMGAPQTAVQKHQVQRLLKPHDFYTRASPFTNFSNHLVMSSTFNRQFFNSEALYQAYKCVSTDQATIEKLAATTAPKTAKAIGRKCQLRSDWETVKFDCMCQTLLDKVRSNPELVQTVLVTGIQPIFEHTTNDNVWGDNGDRTGQNLLGKAWWSIRMLLITSTSP